MNLSSNNSQIFFFLKFNGICSSVAESPLHPLLPTNTNMAGFVGEAVLSGFIQKLVDMVTSPELWKYARKEQVDSKLKRWKNILIKIYVVLNDAEEKQMTNPLVKIWLDELRDLGYDVEDILDDFATEALRSSLIMAQPQQGTSKVRGMLSSLIPSASTSNSSMRSKIEEITARLQDISAQKNDLDLREIAGGWWSDRKRKRAQILPTTSLVVESDVYGRETDKAAIVDMLLKHDPSSDDEVSVIPIVGMGGIGKTTLAQLAFNDDEVKGRFDLRAWVCVSDDFDVLRITKTILQSVDPDTRDVNDLNLLQVKLKEKFSGKKFLLVLDDVWNENSHEWDTLCMPMRAGAPGSKLIVTTRNEGVAAVTRTCPAYSLRELSDNDCLSLFTQQALRTRNFDAHPHLKEVGEEIVRRCKGLPLAAKALGGMLRNQLSPVAWANILTSRIWDLPGKKSNILPALKLSYHHLPSHLKRCFAYCSMFPKDYEFDKDYLVLLWMAEGFLQKTNEAARPEDLGSKYFDDLFSRSFFQHSSQYSSRYVMHDLINDLAQSVAGEIYFHLDSAWENNKQSTIYEKTRHSSFNRQEYETQRKFEPFHKVKCLRTLVALPMEVTHGYNFISSKVLDDLLKEVKYLRVLSLSDYQINELPDSIGNLKYLRYLNLSGSSIRRLPDSVCLLYNLQALILSYCRNLTMLPVGIGNLINLRHLHIFDTWELQEMPSQIGNLTKLQTLSKFIVGEGNNLGLRELKNLFDLRGELSILGLHNVMNIRDGRDANLESKHGIEELRMKWSDDFGASRNEMHERNVLEQLRPHRNLKKLTIASYGGSEFPSWMKDPSFPIMTHLILKGCKRCTSLPALGQLSSLKVLRIEGMSEVRTINEEFYGGIVKPFPSLESLNFEVMAEWEYWFCPDAVNEGELFPCLRFLTIRDCRKLQQLPNCLPSQVKLDISCCPNLGFASSRFASLGEVSLEARDERVRISEVISGVVGGLHAVMRWSDWLVLLEEQRLSCNLKMLRIQDDANLEKLPNGLQTLTCLEQLEIRRCPKLESFPETGLPPMLRSLKVIGCENLKWLPHNYNSCALEFLDITSCPSLRCFPNCELPTTLKSLWIKDCKNLEALPEGMTHHDSTCCLEKLKITGCPRLESFPDTGLPPLLRRLEVSNCKGLKSLPHNYSSCALESLEISFCSSLKSFSTRELPSTLKKLEIRACPDLESMSENMCPNNSALDNLVLGGYPNLKILPECLHSLKSLRIIDCDGLECFPARGLSTPTLTELYISACQNLKSLPHQMRDLKSLRDLTISFCPGVESFPEDGMPPNLILLHISHCENLKKPILAFHTLTSLSSLTIKDVFPDMVSFPDEECLLPISLTSLRIAKMESLAYLSLQNLISLQSLDVSYCPNLRSLGSMPATLEKLEILCCPILEERYSKEKGEYWPNVAHIPCIEIKDEDFY
ncbi:putative disease resistance RPP13-like protein 1 [Vitis riparia]|uniref:putative disease resistance RPP13-like protein 1 n=1 Tax=Vitis riparia TaxID=96939 RepID=UPI00155A17B0|nr:putative disease resistance RPP13-like protein 1 [Vitis riparia]